MIKDPSDDFVANPIKDDMFCWHFTIRGPPETEFEGGLYHGVIKLPMNYPNKPPNIMFLTPNGRFDINMDVCLSMTQYHKEEWQAAWTIRSMLEAIIAFFPVKEDHDAIGALELSEENRKYYAKQSVKYKCDICGPIVNLLKPLEKPESDKKNNENEKKDNNNKGDDNESKKEVVKNISKNETNINNDIKNNLVDEKKSTNEKKVQKEVESVKFFTTNPFVKKNEKEIITIKKIDMNEKEEKKIEINSNNENNVHNLFYIDKNKDNMLIKSILDDIENTGIKKSIKYFGQQNITEIESKLKSSNRKNKKVKNDLDFDDVKIKNVEKYLENIGKTLDFIKYIKFRSRVNFEEHRDKIKKNLMIWMVGIMIVIFVCYFIFKKFETNISQFVKKSFTYPK